MKIVIVGVGNVGRELVKQLSREGHDIIVVDTNTKLVEEMVNIFDVMGITGNGVSLSTMNETGINTCDLLIACTQYDEMNMLCCLVGKKLGAKETIARVKNREYSELFSSRELGISMLVNPDYESALEISRLLRFPSAIKIEPFAEGRVDIIEFKVTKDSILYNVALKDLSDVLKTKILVCAVERDGEVTIPNGNFTLIDGDKIYVTASKRAMHNFFRDLGQAQNAKKVMIIGGSRIATYLSQELAKVDVNVKIIEKSESKCALLMENLEKATVINGDGTDRNLLVEEGLLDCDALIVLTDLDEQNIIISMHASTMGVKVITKIDNVSYYPLLENSGIDSVVATKATTANEIIKCVRGMANSMDSAVNKLYRIVDGKAEVLEFKVTPSFKGLSIPFSIIKLKKNTLIAGIIRDGNLITPSGNDTLESDDLVLVVTLHDNFDDLNDILE